MIDDNHRRRRRASEGRSVVSGERCAVRLCVNRGEYGSGEMARRCEGDMDLAGKEGSREKGTRVAAK